MSGSEFIVVKTKDGVDGVNYQVMKRRTDTLVYEPYCVKMYSCSDSIDKAEHLNKYHAGLKFVINTTGKTIEEVEALTVVGKIKNNWIRRDITLYADEATLEAMKDQGALAYLYMVGVSFDGPRAVISKECLNVNKRTAMEYWKNGQKVLVLS